MIIESARIDIKPLNKAELELYIKSRSEFERQTLLNASGIVVANECCEELQEIIDNNPAIWNNKRKDYLLFTLWLLIDREARTIVGQFWFGGKPSPQGEVEIFFSIEKPHRGKGYASESVQALLSWVKQSKIFRILFVEVYGDNAAALASLKKLGFRRVPSDDDENTSKYYMVVYHNDNETELFDFEV
jgi:RimJ/RimL family protein N-acetyltransferase